LDYALFEETQGETEKAKTIYLGALSLGMLHAVVYRVWEVLIFAIAPGHVESVIRWAEFHKRLGDVQTACNILSEAIASSQFEVAAPFLAMNLARLQVSAFRCFKTVQSPEALILIGACTWQYCFGTRYVPGSHRQDT